jgi:GTP-binding protein
MALPKIAIVGRPNVGKSALFNRIVGKRISIVDEEEGITRDRLYAEAEVFGRPFLIIDTGGIDFSGKVPFNQEIRQQALFAVQEADAIIFVVDGQVGPMTQDEEVARILLKSGKPVVLAVNKIDRSYQEVRAFDFLSLGFSEVAPVSALQGYKVAELLEATVKLLPTAEQAAATPAIETIRVAIVGRPNVGKSTLLNELLDEERSIVSPIAGTTRDAIDVPVEIEGRQYLLIDTAGIRRKKSEREAVDKFAAIRTEQAIDR